MDYSQFISPSDHRYLECTHNPDDPFACFCILAKVHKSQWCSCPITSCSASLCNGLGKKLDQELLPIIKHLPLYLPSSTTLKHCLDSLHMAHLLISIFTCDAQSMYTYILMDRTLTTIATYLCQCPYCHNSGAIIQGLEILMHHNVFQFGNTYWIQLNGTTMGTPPAPAYATLNFGIHKLTFLPYLPQFTPSLPLYHCYIGNVSGVWFHHPDLTYDDNALNCFQYVMNSSGNLTCSFTPHSLSTHFMDLTITISPTGFSTAIYEKPLNLYQHLPPHSSHVPGLTQGFITGLIHCTLRLMTHAADQRSALCLLFT